MNTWTIRFCWGAFFGSFTGFTLKLWGWASGLFFRKWLNSTRPRIWKCIFPHNKCEQWLDFHWLLRWESIVKYQSIEHSLDWTLFPFFAISQDPSSTRQGTVTFTLPLLTWQVWQTTNIKQVVGGPGSINQVLGARANHQSIPPKFNSSPLKNGGWKTTFLLGKVTLEGRCKIYEISGVSWHVNKVILTVDAQEPKLTNQFLLFTPWTPCGASGAHFDGVGCHIDDWKIPHIPQHPRNIRVNYWYLNWRFQGDIKTPRINTFWTAHHIFTAQKKGFHKTVSFTTAKFINWVDFRKLFLPSFIKQLHPSTKFKKKKRPQKLKKKHKWHDMAW